MKMETISLILCMFVLSMMISCAHTTSSVQLCENEKCATLTELDSQDAVFLKLTDMIKANLGKKIPMLISSVKDGPTETSINYEWIEVSRQKGYLQIRSLVFADILFLDKEKREAKVEVHLHVTGPRGSNIAKMSCIVAVKSAKEVIIEGNVKLPPFATLYLDVSISSIDIDRALWTSVFELNMNAVNVQSLKKQGYLTLSFPITSYPKTLQQAKQKPVIQQTQTKPDSTLKPDLTYRVTFDDKSGKKIFYGGDEVGIRVEVENTGEGTARDVQAVISGSHALVSYIGNRRFLGDLKRGEKKAVVFSAMLPANIPMETASVQVEVVEGRGFSPAEKQTFATHMKPLASKESVEIIASQMPRLDYTVEITDRNGNKVLDSSEEIIVRVAIENTGEGTADGVNIELAGQKEIIDVLGHGVKVGDLGPKQKKIYEFKGTLPARIPTNTALLKVRIHELHGYSPAGKNYQIAMKAAEDVAEQTVVMSEVDVDDIPARIRGYENSSNYAVVIGIGNYRDKAIPKVKYANRDAETMARYLEHLAGIPKENILIKTDADVTRGDLEDFFESWLPRRASADSTVYVYYAGHGTPDIAGREAYIVPYEGHPDSPGKLYPLKKMYGSLSKLPAKQVIVMLDSCFSGAEGRSVSRQGARPLVMAVENQVLSGDKILVIAGAKGNQISSDYDKARHGLFTYYALRGIRGEADRNGDGVVAVGEFYDYVRQNVSRKASVELNRDQTPDLLPSRASAHALAIPLSRTK
ncbi:MAG: caspase family protein [Deltaproteobacteria bacterium]